MRISSLSEADFPAIHETFLLSFSDYPLPMQQTPEQLRALLSLRGASYEHSFGAFVEGRLVGVWVTAVGPLDGVQTGYTVFTGILKDHRGRGLGQDLFRSVARSLGESGVSRVVHEVLIENPRAIRAYQKMGFLVRRDLVCLRIPDTTRLQKRAGSDDPVEIQPVGELDPKVTLACRDWQPTWPCSDGTIERAEVSVQLEARVDGRVVGYAVVLPPQAGGGFVDVPQLAVERSHRRRGIATRLLSTVVAVLPPGAGLRVLNVDASADGDLAFWRSLGAEEITRQHDMEWIAP